jgi:signal peptidase II
MPAVSARRYALFCGIAAGGCALDLLTKHVAFQRLGMPGGESHWLIPEVFGFTTSLNEGALFGIGQGQGMIFCALSIIAALGIGYWLFVAGAAQDLWLTVALACVTAGIFGNLYDRLGLPGLTWQPGYGHAPDERVYAVRDWLHFKVEPLIDWPIFNIADTLLVCGAALMVLHALRSEKRAKATAGASQE